jgi:hypothetical protein
MGTTKKPAPNSDATRLLAAIEINIKQLVELYGDSDEAVYEGASKALVRIDEILVEALSDMILRPKSPLQRIRGIFAVRFIRAQNPHAAQVALLKVERSEKDKRIADLASAVLFGLTSDEIDRKAVEERERKLSLAIANPATTEAYTDREIKQVNDRLAELRTQE